MTYRNAPRAARTAVTVYPDPPVEGLLPCTVVKLLTKAGDTFISPIDTEGFDRATTEGFKFCIAVKGKNIPYLIITRPGEWHYYHRWIMGAKEGDVVHHCMHSLFNTKAELEFIAGGVPEHNRLHAAAKTKIKKRFEHIQMFGGFDSQEQAEECWARHLAEESE